MRKNSVKNFRINSEVAREISRIISREIKDPRIDPMTSVVRAEVTADLKYCKVYVSILGSEEARKNTMAGLRSATPFIRHMLAETVNLRLTPEITFIEDESIEYGVRMTNLINQVTAKDRADEIARGEDPDAVKPEGGAGPEAEGPEGGAGPETEGPEGGKAE